MPREFKREARSFPVQAVRDFLEGMVFKPHLEGYRQFGYASDNMLIQFINNSYPTLTGPSSMADTEDNSGREQRLPLPLGSSQFRREESWNMFKKQSNNKSEIQGEGYLPAWLWEVMQIIRNGPIIVLIGCGGVHGCIMLYNLLSVLYRI